MKKSIGLILIGLTCLITGCTTTGNSLLGTAKPLFGNDYYGAGKTVGETGYFAYILIKDDEKYADIVKECEQIYAQVDSQDTEITLGTINKIGIELGQAALATKYGYAKATMIITAIQIGGTIIDRIVAEKVDTVAASQFLNGFKDGIDIAKAKTPADALIPAEQEKKVKVFDCPDGNCSFTSLSKDVKFQQRLAQQIIDDGYADKDEVVKEGHNAYTNCKDLVTRCKTLRKFNIPETRCYIHHFTIKDGKLAEIEFHMIGYENEFVTTCVACEVYIELDDIEVEY